MINQKMILTLLVSSLFFIGITTLKADDTKAIIDTSFEDGDFSMLEPRGPVTFEIGKDGGATGDNYLKVNGRNESWNGVNIKLDDICEPGEQYTVSAAIKTAWYGTVTLSFQYTDSTGTEHYNNLQSVVSQGEWVKMKEYKFSMLPDVTDVYIYFECSDANLAFQLDDLSLKAAASGSIEKDIPSLKETFEKYFKIGTATTTSELAPRITKDLIKKHFNSITVGNELKPENLLDRAACQKEAEGGDQLNPQVSLGAAEPILNFARDNDIPVRGHVLVWHSQTPDWFFKKNYADDGAWLDKDDMLKRMENYIKNVFEAVTTKYPEIDFYAWDVANECFEDDGSPRKGGDGGGSNGQSAWVKVFGDNSFIQPAFEYARKYAPKTTKLYYNDYNEYIQGKTDAMIKLAKDFKEKGILDGLGLQSHLDIGFPNAEQYKSALSKFAAAGVDIQITELDVTTNEKSEFTNQAKYYGDIFKAIMANKDAISAVVFWGTTDDKSWRAQQSPLLFNGDYTAKPCFYSIAETAK